MLWLPLGISNHREAKDYYWGCKWTSIYSNEFTIEQYLITIFLFLNQLSYPSFPGILLPISVLQSPYVLPSTWGARTPGKLLSIVSPGELAGWLGQTASAGGLCRLLCAGGGEDATDPAWVQYFDQGPCAMAYIAQVFKRHPGKTQCSYSCQTQCCGGNCLSWWQQGVWKPRDVNQLECACLWWCTFLFCGTSAEAVFIIWS